MLTISLPAGLTDEEVQLHLRQVRESRLSAVFRAAWERQAKGTKLEPEHVILQVLDEHKAAPGAELDEFLRKEATRDGEGPGKGLSQRTKDLCVAVSLSAKSSPSLGDLIVVLREKVVPQLPKRPAVALSILLSGIVVDSLEAAAQESALVSRQNALQQAAHELKLPILSTLGEDLVSRAARRILDAPVNAPNAPRNRSLTEVVAMFLGRMVLNSVVLLCEDESQALQLVLELAGEIAQGAYGTWRPRLWAIRTPDLYRWCMARQLQGRWRFWADLGAEIRQACRDTDSASGVVLFVPNVALLLTDQAVTLAVPAELKPAMESHQIQFLGSSRPDEWERARVQAESVSAWFNSYPIGG